MQAACEIRIACCGMVVTTRPFPDDADINELADDIRETARLLEQYGEVNVWISQGNMIWPVRMWTYELL